MTFEFRSSFNSDVKALSDKNIKDSVIKIISDIENITDINTIHEPLTIHLSPKNKRFDTIQFLFPKNNIFRLLL